MMDRTEHALFARMEADLVALTQRVGEDRIAIAAHEREIAFLRATLSHIDDILAEDHDAPAIARVRIFIECALNAGRDARHG